MKYIFLLMLFPFTFLCSASIYPSSFAKLGTPLYKDADKIILLQNIISLETLVSKHLQKLKLAAIMGAKADDSLNKEVKMNYLKALRPLQKSHDKIIGLSKILLVDAMKNNEYETFLAIVETDIKDILNKKSLNKQIIDFYIKNKTNKRSLVIDRLMNKLNVNYTVNKSNNTSEITSKMLYKKAKNLIDNYSGQPGLLQRASELTQKLLNREPNNPLALINKGRLILQNGYINGYNFNQEAILKAQNIFKRVQKNNPNLFDAYYFSAEAFLFDKTDTGLINAKKMIKICKNLQPKSLKLQAMYAEVARVEKKYEELEQISKHILSNASETWMINNAYSNLMLVYQVQKKYTLLNDTHLKIIELSPDSPWAMINYCAFLHTQSSFDKAIIYGKKALSLLDFELGHYHIAKAYYKKGAYLNWEQKEKEKSRVFFLKAIEHDSEYTNAYYGIGMSYYYTGYHTKNISDLKKSKIALKKAIQLKPNHKQAIQHLKEVNKLLTTIDY